MWTAWEWKLLWKSFSDFNRTERPAWEHTTRAKWGKKGKKNQLDVSNDKAENRFSVKSEVTRCTQRSLTVEPHGNSFFQGVKFSVQTISRGRVA